MGHGTSRFCLVLAAGVALGCGTPTAELEGELLGLPEEIAEPGRGRYVIDGEEIELDYQTINGHRTFEGDIVLDDEVELGGDETAEGEVGVAAEPLFAVSSDSRLWPRGVVPYVIHSSVSTPGRVRTAIRTWEATGIRFVPRTTQRAYVTFSEEPGNSVCRAQVGYNGAHRYVYLRDTSRYSACNLGVVVHETGHVLGLWHEHTRPDRGSHVTIHWSHVPSAHRDAFEIMTSGARRVGGYDITSTMHYRSYTLTSDGRASITRSDGRVLLHDWATISRGDVAAIRTLYFDGTPVPRPDAGVPDAGRPDAGARDAGLPDAGPRDAGPRDAGPGDAGTRPDAMPVMATPDAGPTALGTPPLPVGALDPDEMVDGEPDFTGDDIDEDRSLHSGCTAAAGRGGSRVTLLFFAALLGACARRRSARGRAR